MPGGQASFGLELPKKLEPFRSFIDDALNREKRGTITEDHQSYLDEMRTQGVKLPRPEVSTGFKRTTEIATEQVVEGAGRVRRGLSVLLDDPKDVGMFDPVQLPIGILQLWPPFLVSNILAKQSGEIVARESGIPALGSFQELLGSGAGGGVTSRGISKGLKFLPGGQAARAEMAIERARALPGVLKPPRPSSELYEELAAFKPQIQISKFRREVDRLLQIEEKTSRGSQDPKLLWNLKGFKEDLFEGPDDFIDFDQLRIELSSIGGRIGEEEKKGGKAWGAFKSLKKAMESDLDDAVVRATNTEAVKKLREASFAFRKELAQERLGRIVEGAISERRGSAGLIDINPQTILKRLRTDKFFAERISKQEMGEIVKTLNQLNKNPPVPAPGGTDIGFGRIGSLGAAGATAGLAAQGLGADVSTNLIIGLGLGVITANMVITKALMSPFGRKMLIRLNKSRPMTTASVAALASAMNMVERKLPPQGPSAEVQAQIKQLMGQ